MKCRIVAEEVDLGNEFPIQFFEYSLDFFTMFGAIQFKGSKKIISSDKPNLWQPLCGQQAHDIMQSQVPTPNKSLVGLASNPPGYLHKLLRNFDEDAYHDVKASSQQMSQLDWQTKSRTCDRSWSCRLGVFFLCIRDICYMS